MKAIRSATVVVACLSLAGCAPGAANYRSQMADTQTHPKPDVPPAPDLRIPAGAVVPSQDIPLVPVPPVPLGRGVSTAPADAPRPNLPPVQAPVLPPVPGPSAGVRQASADMPSDAPPSNTTPEAKGVSLRELQQQAASWYAGVDSYIVRMTRREVVGGAAKPEEILKLSFRKDPWSVHLKWVGKVGEGREVLYVKGMYDNQIQTRLAAGDMPFTPAGMLMKFAVNSPMVRSASRHSITDAGLGSSIDRLGAYLDSQERGDKTRGGVTDLGMQTRPEFNNRPARGVQVALLPGAEPELPNGGKRLYFFDPDLHLPMLIVTYDDKNREVEYYHYDRLIAPAALDADDFNPDKLWNAPRTAGK